MSLPPTAMEDPPSNGPRFLGPLAWFDAGRRLYTRNLLPALLIPLAVFLPLTLLAAAALATGHVATCLSRALPGATPDLLPAALVETYLAVTSLLFLVLTPALVAGVFACFLDGIRTGKLTARRLGDGFRSWWSCTWVVWLLVSCSTISLPLIAVLIGVPTLVAAQALLWLALFRLVDARRGGLDALLFAWHVLQGRWPMLIIFTFLVTTLFTAGTVVLVGFATTTPLLLGTLAAGYEALREGERESCEPRTT